MVEIACYRIPRGKGDEILAVPRIVQEVEPVERAYVRIDVSEALEGKLAITPQVEPDRVKSGGGRRTLSEEEFFDTVEREAGRECRESMEGFYQGLISTGRIVGALKASSLMLKLEDPTGEHPGASLLALDCRGRIYNTRFLSGQLKRSGLDRGVADQIATDYWRRLNQLDPRFKAKGIVHLAPQQFLPFKELRPVLPGITKEVLRVIERIDEERELGG